MKGDRQFGALWREAKEAGRAAGAGARPAPMVVGEAKSLVSDEIDYSRPVYRVPEGACGFAWVIVRPGNSRFANWLKRRGYGRTDSYYGGVCIWVSEHGQSVERKAAHARALAAVLREAGITACEYERLD